MITVAFALPMELRPVLRRGKFRKGRAAGNTIYRGGIGGTDAVLFCSGVGADRAYSAARNIIDLLKPSLYISAGLCGSVSDEAAVGDVHVAEGILSLADGNFELVYGPEDGLLVSPAALAGLKSSILISSDRVLVTSSEKRAVHERRPGAATVDMESAGAARAAREAGIPFMAIKAVSDGHEEDLPVDFNRFTKEDGSMKIARLVLHVLTHPRKIAPLRRLSRNSKAAADNLAAGLGELLPRLAAL